MVREPYGGTEDSILDSIGILQIIWLIHRSPDLDVLISQVKDPSVDNLRVAGKFNLCMARDKDADLEERKELLRTCRATEGNSPSDIEQVRRPGSVHAMSSNS